MILRLATLADIGLIMDLERACSTAAHWTEPQYRQLFQTGSGTTTLLLVAEGVQKGAGTASLDTPSRSHSGLLGFLVARHLAPEWELENIVVAPTAQRQGIGAGLLNALLKRARETDSEAVFLEVRESNEAARQLYEKAGFRQTGRRKAYYPQPQEDAILYRLPLT